MGHLEGNFTPILYIGRKVSKGYPQQTAFISTKCYMKFRRLYPLHARASAKLSARSDCARPKIERVTGSSSY